MAERRWGVPNCKQDSESVERGIGHGEYEQPSQSYQHQKCFHCAKTSHSQDGLEHTDATLLVITRWITQPRNGFRTDSKAIPHLSDITPRFRPYAAIMAIRT